MVSIRLGSEDARDQEQYASNKNVNTPCPEAVIHDP